MDLIVKARNLEIVLNNPVLHAQSTKACRFCILTWTTLTVAKTSAMALFSVSAVNITHSHSFYISTKVIFLEDLNWLPIALEIKCLSP